MSSWQNHRLQQRLELQPTIIEQVYTAIAEFSRKTVVEALGFPERTVEAIIHKLVELKRIQRIGQGRTTRYRLVDK